MTTQSLTEFTLPDNFLHGPIRVTMVGCGGTGSHLLPQLARLHRSMIALGHPGGLEVTVWDDDTVSDHNCLRQTFFPADVGRNKALTLVNRINIAHGLAWKAEPRRFGDNPERGFRDCDVIVGCVDTKNARRSIDRYVREGHRSCIWIDAGNSANSGQIIAGVGGRSAMADPMRLPLVSDLLPEIISGDDADTAPSCSAVESLLRQGPAVNFMAASWVYAWLAQVVQFGRIGWHGVFFNMENGRSQSIAVDPKVWAGFGYTHAPLKEAA